MSYAKLKAVAQFYLRFLPSFSAIGYHVRRLVWPDVATDFRGQQWLVTGASRGLGREIARLAAMHGATVLAAGNDAQELSDMISTFTANGVTAPAIEVVDFSSQQQTHELLQRLTDAGRRIDVLINNVGFLPTRHELTSEGREASYVVNLLSIYHLTEGAIARGLLKTNAVVINMASGGAYSAALNVRRLNYTKAENFVGAGAYAYHKRALIVLAEYWRQRYAQHPISFYVMHPGWARTPGVRQSMPTFNWLMRPILRTPTAGVDTAIWLAATRPVQAPGEAVWFDRKARPAHMTAATRLTRDHAQSLVAALDADLGRFPHFTS